MAIKSYKKAVPDSAQRDTILKAQKNAAQVMDVEKEARDKKNKEIQDRALLGRFQEWIKDKSELEDYAMYEFLHPEILIRLFVDIPPTDKKITLLGLEGENLSAAVKTTFTCYAKVLRVSKECTGVYKDLQPGDIVTVSDSMSTITENPDWHHYQDLKNQRPAPQNLPNVPRFVPKIQMWKDKLFFKDKLIAKTDMNDQDALTFLVPQTTILTKYNHVFKDITSTELQKQETSSPTLLREIEY